VGRGIKLHRILALGQLAVFLALLLIARRPVDEAAWAIDRPDPPWTDLAFVINAPATVVVMSVCAALGTKNIRYLYTGVGVVSFVMWWVIGLWMEHLWRLWTRRSSVCMSTRFLCWAGALALSIGTSLMWVLHSRGRMVTNSVETWGALGIWPTAIVFMLLATAGRHGADTRPLR
jgi:hypothetical protein